MNKSNGIGFCGILGIVFIILKLIKVIKWSWFWVLSPFWIGILIDVIIYLLVAIWLWWLGK